MAEFIRTEYGMIDAEEAAMRLKELAIENQYLQAYIKDLEQRIISHPGEELIIIIRDDELFPEKKVVTLYGPQTGRKLSLSRISDIKIIRRDKDELLPEGKKADIKDGLG